MTKEERRKQIEEEALNYRSNPDRSGYTIDTFIDAAEWADKHPVRDIDEELDKAACKYFDKGFQDAKIDFINKASMWLKYNASKFIYKSAFDEEAKINESKLAEEFIKAMEE